MTTNKEGILMLRNDKGELVAIVVKDEAIRKNVIYITAEAGLEEIENLFKNTDVKTA